MKLRYILTNGLPFFKGLKRMDMVSLFMLEKVGVMKMLGML